jgi:Flp pilus assembly protein TadG
MSRTYRKRSHQDGAAAVEFALIAMILIMLLFGIIQFGFTFFEYIEVAHAANAGARWAALGATNAEIDAQARSAAPLLPNRAAMTIAVNPGSTSDSVRVTVTYPRTDLVPFFALPAMISSSAEQRLE